MTISFPGRTPWILTNRWAVPAVAGDVQRTARAFAAAHREDDCFRFDREDAVLTVHRRDRAVGGDGQHHGFGQDRNVPLADLRDVPRGVFRTGQFFAVAVQSEPVVDTLLQNSAGGGVAFEQEQILHARVIGGDGGGKSRGTGADDGNLCFHACSAPFFSVPASNRLPGAPLQSSVGALPVSFASSSTSSGVQNPP